MLRTLGIVGIFLTFAAVALSGCAIGFNKNGLYCTEGPTENAPNCFNPKRETAPEPAAAAVPPSAAPVKAGARN